MNILKEVKEFYDKIECDAFADITQYLQMGYLFSSPKYIIFGKPVRRDGGDPNEQWNPVAPDAWYVRCAGGENSISEFIEAMPFPLPYIGWQRQLKNKQVRFFELEKILRRKN